MSKVIKLYPKDSAKNPDAVLEQAVGQFSDVLIIGWNIDESLDIRSNLGMDAKEALWLIEQFKRKLLAGDYSND